MKILKESFGKLKNGKEVIKYSLINDNMLTVNILNYGGIITEIMAPNRKGKFENVVLGFSNIKDYEEKSPYFGAIVGRTAGRISNARFEIDGEEYILEKNSDKHNLHGGNKGFDKVIWDVEEIIEKDYIGMKMNYISKDGEEGFPGNLDVKVIYFLNNDNELRIQYIATPDKKTIINLTNHSYFNLSGNLKEDILNHKLIINADKVGYVDNEVIPNGQIANVENTVFDFRKLKTVGKDINKDIEQIRNCGGYDHPFILNKRGGFSAILEDDKSGRGLKIRTDQQVIVFYSGNFLGEELILNKEKKCKDHLGLCLEAQDYPDAINQINFPSKIYKPGEKYKACTKYKFYINE